MNGNTIPENAQSADLAVLMEVLDKLLQMFREKPSQVKVGDILKLIELKQKISIGAGGDIANRQFWDIVNKFRQNELQKEEAATTSPEGSTDKGDAPC
jgi:ribosomal protein RSM22 (predicted rRNA methylase)